MNNYSSQLKALKSVNYSFGLSYFSPDDCNMVNRFIPKTGLRLIFVYEYLKKYRTECISKRGLSGKVVSLRTDLYNYIDKRIYLLNHLKEIDANSSLLFKSSQGPKMGSDPWLSYLSQDSSHEKELVEASLHVRDVMFSAHEVIAVIPEAAQTFREELKVFIKVLPSYLGFLNQLTNDEKENIKEIFAQLRHLMKNEELVGVKEHLSLIRKSMRHVGHFLKLEEPIIH